MNGMHVVPLDDIAFLREITSKNNACLIFDEVQTGVGRTGTFSYSQGIGMFPDIISMAKSLASGVPIGAVIMPESIAQHIKSGDLGTTFGGGMIAMAAHKATLEEIIQGNWMQHATEIFDYAYQRCNQLGIGLRGKGCLLGLVFESDTKTIRDELLKNGYITGSSNQANVIRLMPPINTPISVFSDFFDCLESIIVNPTSSH
jgi:acetylornithine/succinyldiaminopimelate/putrescine aminotransferase